MDLLSRLTLENVDYEAAVFYLLAWPEFQMPWTQVCAEFNAIAKAVGPNVNEEVHFTIAQNTPLIAACTITTLEKESMPGRAAYEGFVGAKPPGKSYIRHLEGFQLEGKPLVRVSDVRDLGGFDLLYVLMHEYYVGLGVRSAMSEDCYQSVSSEELRNDPWMLNVMGLRFANKQFVEELQDLDKNPWAVGFYYSLWIGRALIENEINDFVK